MINKNSNIVIIPPSVEKILNHPVTDASPVIYEEYEPEITKEDIPRITEKLSTTYSYLFLEDVPDIKYVDSDIKSKYEKLNTPVIVFTCGEIRYVYHRLKNEINISEDNKIQDLIDNEKYTELIPYEIALILLNEYNLKTRHYSKTDMEKAVDFIRTNDYYKNVDLNAIKDEIITILKPVIDENDLKQILNSQEEN